MRLAFQDNIQEYNQERGLSVTESCLTPKENKNNYKYHGDRQMPYIRSIHKRQGDHE